MVPLSLSFLCSKADAGITIAHTNNTLNKVMLVFDYDARG